MTKNFFAPPCDVRYILEKLRELQQTLEGGRADERAIIFHNEEIASGKKRKKAVDSVKFPQLCRVGVRRVEDFYDADGRIIKAQEAIRRGLPKEAIFEWVKITTLLKTKDFRDARNATHSIITRGEKNTQTPDLKLGDITVPWAEATQKRLLKTIAHKRKITLTPHQTRMASRHDITEEEWNRLYRYNKKTLYCHKEKRLPIFMD